jgi:opacity protein-like surface antigen
MQGMKLLRRVIGGFSLLLLAVPAFAEMSLPAGWYLEANLGSSNLNGVNYSGSMSSTGVGYNANLGYKFMPYVAAEFGYTGYANSTITNNAGTKAGIVKHYSYDLAARGILPFSNSGFEAFAKLGAQRLSANLSTQNPAAAAGLGLTNSSHSTTGLYLGAGIQYYFMPEMAVNAQWMQAKGDSSTGTSTLLSGGLSFIFG